MSFTPALMYTKTIYKFPAMGILSKDYSVTEVFIPSKQLIFNSLGDIFSCKEPLNFECYGTGDLAIRIRVTPEEIQLSDELFMEITSLYEKALKEQQERENQVKILLENVQFSKCKTEK